MMEHCGYGIIAGFEHVPPGCVADNGYSEFDRYTTSYIGSTNDTGLYGRRVLQNYWDRSSNESECTDISMDTTAYPQMPLPAGAGEHASNTAQLQEPSTLDGSCPGASQFGYLEWKDFSSRSSQYYQAYETKKFSDLNEYGDKTVQSNCYLPPLSELNEFPPLASSYQTCINYNAISQGSAEAQPFCHSSPLQSHVVLQGDNWRSGLVASDDVVQETKRRSSCGSSGQSMPTEPVCTSHGVQIPRIHSTSSGLPSTRKGSSIAHHSQKQASSRHGRRKQADVSQHVVDVDEKKLWERDPKKKKVPTAPLR